MTSEFALLLDDKKIRHRWYLKAPVAANGKVVDPRMFLNGRVVEILSPLRIPLRRDGQPLDFTLADFDMPVVREDIGQAIRKLAPNEVQLIPATIDGSAIDYAVLNVTSTVPCLDEQRSGVTHWKATEGQPHRDGEYRMVLTPKVDPRMAAGHRIFRIAGWEVAVVVSKELAQLLADVRGVALEPAS